MEDYLYIYDKTTFARQPLGEVQNDFNISEVLDGTKDSAKMEVFSYNGTPVEPNTIAKHKATKKWFIVSNDKVERYVDDRGYWYKHTVELQGAIELLNARDMPNLGFNQGRYTLRQVLRRILELSNFEFTFTFYFEVLNADVVLDYVKTFENYTPYSAIRELLNGYNSTAKLRFHEDENGAIDYAILDVVSKTGRVSVEPFTEDYFNLVQQVDTLDKNSFGTSVISNAENVISTKHKTYPASGAIRATGTKYEFGGYSNGGAVLRLPSDIYKVNWVKMYASTPLYIQFSSPSIGFEYKFYAFDDVSIETAYNGIVNLIEARGYSSTDFKNSFPKERLRNYGFRTFHYTDKYNAITKRLVSEYTLPIRKPWDETKPETPTTISSKEMKTLVQNEDDVFYFERGKNVIEGFSFCGADGADKNWVRFARTNEGTVYSDSNFEVGVGGVGEYPRYFYFPDCRFVIDYIPMGDIKIKQDNVGMSRDTQIYNQNGKLTDSEALSKSLLSYAKEIESDTVTKYGTLYYGYRDIDNTTYASKRLPNVGDIVILNNNKYVINNISTDYFQSERSLTNSTDIEYKLNCEFTMSKQIAVKSLMVNPNQNIRDYGIPQEFNVKRKQLYRDFYELTYVKESNQNNWYLPLNKILNVEFEIKPYNEHTAVIRAMYSYTVGGQDRWYYQVNGTVYYLKKSIYEIFDFVDNNIIGYGAQNTWSGFDITRLLTDQYDLINTPISYVDTNGEVRDFTIALCTNEKLSTIYKNYMSHYTFTTGSFGPWYSCFIPYEIFDAAITYGNYDFIINETGYNKDATEVPVFEYSCQIDDTDDVLIGNNILEPSKLTANYFSYKLEPRFYYDNNSFDPTRMSHVVRYPSGYYHLNNAVRFVYNQNDELLILLYEELTVDLNDNPTYSGLIDLEDEEFDIDNNDIVIGRPAMVSAPEDVDLIMILRRLKENKSICIAERTIDNQTVKCLVLKINYYKAH